MDSCLSSPSWYSSLLSPWVSVPYPGYSTWSSFLLRPGPSPPLSAPPSTGSSHSWWLSSSPSLVTPSALLPATSSSPASLSSGPSLFSSLCRRPRAKLRTRFENIFRSNVQCTKWFLLFITCGKSLIKLDYILDRNMITLSYVLLGSSNI